MIKEKLLVTGHWILDTGCWKQPTANSPQPTAQLLFPYKLPNLLHILFTDLIKDFHFTILIVVDPDIIFDAGFSVNGCQCSIPVGIINIVPDMCGHIIELIPVEFYRNLEIFHGSVFIVLQGAVVDDGHQKILRYPDQSGIWFYIFTRNEGDALIFKGFENCRHLFIIAEVFDPDTLYHAVLEEHPCRGTVKCEAVLLLNCFYRSDDEFISVFCPAEQK